MTLEELLELSAKAIRNFDKWPKAIMIWPFADAPEEWQALSPHGGDEDWVAFIPTEIYEKFGIPIWVENLSGTWTYSYHPVAGGIVVITAHA